VRAWLVSKLPRSPRRIYRFGDFQFPSKDAARQFFGEIRRGLELGSTITNPAYAIAVAELFRGHIEHANKAKCGVKRFYVNQAPDHPNTTCFWIEREDGSVTDFGFAACVQTIGGLNRQSFRAIVRGQIYAFKDKRLVGCREMFASDYSGKTFPISEAHVDHEIEFEEILTRFAAAERIDLEVELLTVSCDAKSEPTWKEEGLASRFLSFHERFPLRLVSKRENLSELRRKKEDVISVEVALKA